MAGSMEGLEVLLGLFSIKNCHCLDFRLFFEQADIAVDFGYVVVGGGDTSRRVVGITGTGYPGAVSVENDEIAVTFVEHYGGNTLTDDVFRLGMSHAGGASVGDGVEVVLGFVQVKFARHIGKVWLRG